MKPRDKGGVVDAKLNVYGVEGLKVCDMSILPSNVCAVSARLSGPVHMRSDVIAIEHVFDRAPRRRERGGNHRRCTRNQRRLS